MTLLNLNHFLIITKAELCLHLQSKFYMFVTIFLIFMEILGEKNLLTHLVQSTAK